jgi:hypothetical protein
MNLPPLAEIRDYKRVLLLFDYWKVGVTKRTHGVLQITNQRLDEFALDLSNQFRHYRFAPCLWLNIQNVRTQYHALRDSMKKAHRTIQCYLEARRTEAHNTMITTRACFAALCHGDPKCLLRKYAYADPVREAILRCLLPADTETTVKARAWERGMSEPVMFELPVKRAKLTPREELRVFLSETLARL